MHTVRVGLGVYEVTRLRGWAFRCGGSTGQRKAHRKLSTTGLGALSRDASIGHGNGLVTGPDIEPKKFKTRREAKDWCKVHHPGSPIREIVPLRKRGPTSEGTASGSG
jgi:hypothetical protein